MEASGAYSVKIERETRRWTGGPGAIGYIVIAVLVGIAVLLYFLGAHTNPANGGAIAERGTGFVIGEASGIAAAVLLALTVILASRLAVLELLFGDLTKVYIAHGVVGLTMFAVISFHPMMYLLGGVLLDLGFLGAAHVLVPFHVVVLDWVSYILIAVALIPTMYMRLRFESWRWIHLLLGVAMVLTGYSILIDNTTFDTSQIPALRIYLFVIFGLGTAAFVWVALVRRRVEPKREHEIVGVIPHEAAGAIELLAEPVGPATPFEAGQFVYVDLLDDPAQIDREFEAHPFSVASPPDRRPISLVIEAAGEHTDRVREIAASDRARALIHGAYGRLVIDRPEQRKQLWVAGGIGITPFLAMAGELADHPERYEGYEVTLVVGVDHANQAFAMAELQRCEERFPGLDVHLWDRESQGLPTVAGIAALLDGDPRERAVMISGPEAMIASLTKELTQAGVPRGQIRSERQIGPPGHWGVASPALWWSRAAVTALFATFVVAVIVSVLSRVIFA